MDVKKINHGKLTVYLGISAGTGKTYAMLEAAKERITEGIDLVVGFIETHGSEDLEMMLEQMPLIPLRVEDKQGKVYWDMDIDAVLSRRPQIVVVDNLAHTNLPGYRHAKRYQDVDELLSAGIDVYTTLDIKYLESQKELVAQITGVKVQDSVPDRIINWAEIQFIDILPGELIQRLKEGKFSNLAEGNDIMNIYGSPEVINALRELTMRYTANRVDSQLESTQSKQIKKASIKSGERVMVCISASPFSNRLIHVAHRIAENLHTVWFAVYIKTPNRFALSAAAKEQLNQHLRLAEELGAEIVTYSGADVAEELVKQANLRNISQIVIGKPLEQKRWKIFSDSIVDKVLRNAEGTSVHVIPGKGDGFNDSAVDILAETITEPFNAKMNLKSLVPYLWSFLSLVLLTSVIAPARTLLGPVNITLLYLIPLLFAAAKWGKTQAYFTAVMSVLFIDLFFIIPYYKLTIANVRDIVSLAIFLMVGLITGTLSTRLKKQVVHSQQEESRLSSLYALSREITAVTDIDAILESIVRKVAETVNGQVVILLPEKEGALSAKVKSEPHIVWGDGDLEQAAAVWALEHRQKAGKGTDTFADAAALYLPMFTQQEVHGVIRIQYKEANDYTNPEEQQRLLDAFVGLSTLAINRAKLTEKAREAQMMVDSERLRTALFNSISHDLRTPLASIIGSVTGLLEGDQIYSSTARHDLLQSIYQGAIRMNRFINNLLDMARLESGMLQLKKEWCDLQDIIGVALSQMGDALGGHPLQTNIEAELPLIQADFVLIEQVLINLLDNAVKYSEPSSRIIISACAKTEHIEVTITENGQNLSIIDLEKIFDKFYRLISPLQVSGTGLGLAICKGIIEAHGGKIWAHNSPANSVSFSFTLPKSHDLPTTDLRRDEVI